MTHNKRRLLLAVTLSLLAPLLLVLGSRWLFAQSEPEFLTTPVVRQDLEETVLATGRLEGRKTVSVGAQVSGQLKALHVTLGDRVRQGQLLAEIDPVLQQNDLRDAEAALENVQAQKQARQALLHQYQLAYRRQQKMHDQDAAATAELESAEASLATTRAELAALEAQLTQARVKVDTARANLAYTRITAPMDGEVTALLYQQGQTLNSAQSAPTLLKLADLETMTVRARISEADVIRLKPGLPVYFTILGDPDTRRHSQLRAIEPAPESESEESSSSDSSEAIYYDALFEVPNPDRQLRVAMTAQVSVVLGAAKQALTLPLSALGQAEADGRYAVRVLEANHQAELRRIRLGLSDNLSVQVLDGLAEGEQVILGDSSQLPEQSIQPGPGPGGPGPH